MTARAPLSVLAAGAALLLPLLASTSYAASSPAGDRPGFVPAGPRAAGPDRPVAASSAPVDARTGNLTVRPGEMPGTGSRRLTSAKVEQDLVNDRVEATVVLAEAPGPGAHLFVEFGRVIDTSCHGEVSFSSPTTTPSAGFTRSGRTMTMRIASSEAGYETWDCAFAFLAGDASGAPVYDALIGPLVDVPARPVLEVGKPTLLGKAGQPVKLVPGVWTRLVVPVRNDGRADALDVRITAKGKRVKVKGARIAKVWSGGSDSASVRVKLTKPGRTTVRLRAATAQSAGTRAVRLRSVAAPRPPRSGAYRTRTGDVTFRVKGRKVVGFRATALQTCGGYPDLPTYSQVTYDFPKTSIGRNGIVDRVQRKALYTVSLQLRISGGKVTAGRFTYHGPDRCRASRTFSMKR